jgi:hypothetical protein
MPDLVNFTRFHRHSFDGMSLEASTVASLILQASVDWEIHKLPGHLMISNDEVGNILKYFGIYAGPGTIRMAFAEMYRMGFLATRSKVISRQTPCERHIPDKKALLALIGRTDVVLADGFPKGLQKDMLNKTLQVRWSPIFSFMQRFSPVQGGQPCLT